MFRRQPDRTLTLYYEQTESESEDEDHEEDDDYFSVEPVDIDGENKEDHTYCEKNPDVSGEASSAKQITSDDLDETPKESGPGDASSIHSREEGEKNSQKKSPEREEEDMDSENSYDNKGNKGAVRSKKQAMFASNH